MNRSPPRPPAKPAARPVAVPVAPRTLWRMILGGFGALAAAGLIVWGIAAGVPQQATMGVATAGAQAGFAVRQVSIEGASNQPRLSIYREVLEGGSDSMLLTDLPAIRGRLKELPWVLDANVRRRWPDRLEVDIIEREPVAIWQYRQRLHLIDADGRLLPEDRLEDFRHLPLLVGASANRQAGPLLRMLAERPRLAPHVAAAMWVGDRRWDLRMKSGETVSLPEGPLAPHALARFDALDRQSPLLGRGFVRFDLRIPEKMVVRVSDETGAKAKPSAMVAGTARAREVTI